MKFESLGTLVAVAETGSISGAARQLELSKSMVSERLAELERSLWACPRSGGDGTARYKPGQSGNPAGRPRGIRDKRTELRGLLEPHAAKLVNKAVEMALEGDATAPRICIDRLVPALRPQDLPVAIPPLAGSLLLRQLRRNTSANGIVNLGHCISPRPGLAICVAGADEYTFAR